MNLKVAAFCAQSFAGVTRDAAGVEPITCPPVDEHAFQPGMLEGAQLIYIDLHGEPGGMRFIGDGGRTAIRHDQVLRCDLSQAVVFAVTCFLGEPDHPMLQALLSAGARMVIAGPGPNYGPATNARYGGARLGKFLRQALSYGADPDDAWKLARQFYRLWPGTLQWAVTQDTLGFAAFVRAKDEPDVI